MSGVTSQQSMLTLPRHLIPPLVCPGVRVCLTPDPTSGLSRGSCVPNLPDLYFNLYRIYETDHYLLYYPFIHVISFGQLVL
jgi:hypothetical protein